jgi:hypothetical protein
MLGINFYITITIPASFITCKFILLIYVLSVIDEHEARFGRLQTLFENPMTEVYLLFDQSSLQAFIHFNMFLQREDPIIPVVYEQTTSFLQNLAGKFLTVAAIKEAKGDFSTLDFKDPKFQHPGKILYLYPLYTELLLHTHHWHCK